MKRRSQYRHRKRSRVWIATTRLRARVGRRQTSRGGPVAFASAVPETAPGLCPRPRLGYARECVWRELVGLVEVERGVDGEGEGALLRVKEAPDLPP